jgi:hypothetical protein
MRGGIGKLTLRNRKMTDTTEIKTAFDEIIQGAQASLAEVQTNFTAYTDLQRAQPTDTGETQRVQKSLAEKQTLLRELNRIEDTLNQQYLDYKAQPVSKTFFARIGLTNNQDWTLAFFFLSFGFMMVMLTITLAVQSAAPLRAAGFFLALTTLLAFIIALVIRAVA